jgi:hypothetical protein
LNTTIGLRYGNRGRILAVALVALAGLATPAGAQVAPDSPTPTSSPRSPSDPRIELVAQDPWTQIGGEVAIRLSIANAPPDAIVSFTAYGSVDQKRFFDRAIDGAPQTTPLGIVRTPLAEMPLDAQGYRTAVLPLQSLNCRFVGVYPLGVELRDDDENTVSSFRTMLVVANGTQQIPLQVAWIWPVSAAPSFLPNGATDRSVIDALRPSGRLGRMALALDAVPDVPVTLAPTGDTIEAWIAHSQLDSSITATLDALLTADSALSGPYVPIDLASLVEHQHTAAVDEVLRRGRDAIQPIFGSRLDDRVRVLDPATPGAVERLRSMGVDRLILDPQSLDSPPQTWFPLAQPVHLRTNLTPTGAAPTSAFLTDPVLQEILGSDIPGALRAQLVLSGLAVIARSEPGNVRATVLVNPSKLDAPASLYTALLAGLRDHPYLEPVTAAQAFETVSVEPAARPAIPGTQSTERQVAVVSTAEPAVAAGDYSIHRARLGSFGALTRHGDPIVDDADRSLLASVSNAWPTDIGRARARAHLRVIDRAIEGLLRRIQVPDTRTITLTSRSGEIPLTFRNDTGFPVRVRASLASSKLFFPHGSVIELELPPRSTTVRVAVEARTSGTFPLELEVTSTDGVLSISRRRLEVRSTFVSTVGIVLMVSAAGFLAVWWGFELRRRHRRRSAAT